MPHGDTPALVISLDFELMWGVRDKRTVESYGKNILGAREAIPAMLALFNSYQVRATWAAVGLLLFDNKRDLLAHLPADRPSYVNQFLSPYDNGYIDSIGNNESDDPYHYGLSLARKILECDGMELGSHTFCHYYCLEAGQLQQQFRADLEASIAASNRIAPRPVSLVFPRNQLNPTYLSSCSELGFNAYRGNERAWIYRESPNRDQSFLQRGGRLLDAYLDLSGDNSFLPVPSLGMVSEPSSRFLRPHSQSLRVFKPLLRRRITGAMTSAAKTGRCFHLWWHPHNFGINLRENLATLESILRHYVTLRDSYGMRSMTMGELAGQKGAPA